MADAHKNFAYSTVATAPSPATSGTSLTLASGGGALFPAAPFNVTIWPSSVQALASNAEVARCTAKTTDTLTLTRAQEGSSARSVVVGDQVAATITTRTLTDAETITASVKSYGATGDGSTDDTAAIQAAINAVAAVGGIVYFPSGNYRLNSGSQGALSIPGARSGNQPKPLALIGGPGVTITLSANTPRFCDLTRVADHDLFQDVTVDGFTVDAAAVTTGINHVIIGTYIGGEGTGQRININRLTVRNINCINVLPDDTGTVDLRCIYLVSGQLAANEATRNYITNVRIENCYMAGGNYGIGVIGYGPNVTGINVFLDNIVIRGCSHIRPSLPTAFANVAHYHLGSRGFGGRCLLADSYGSNSADVGVEIDGMTDAVVERVTIDDSWTCQFFTGNFNNAQYPDAQQITHRDCVSRRVNLTNASSQGNGFVAQNFLSVPLGTIRYIDCIHEKLTTGLVSTREAGFYTTTSSGTGLDAKEILFERCKFSAPNVSYGGSTNAVLVGWRLEVSSSTNLRTTFRNCVSSTTAAKTSTGDVISTPAYFWGTQILDIDGFEVASTVTGASLDSHSNQSLDIGRNTGSTIQGTIRRFRWKTVAGGTAPIAITIEGTANLTIPTQIRIEDCDFSQAPSGGSGIFFAGTSNASKVFARANIGVATQFPVPSATITPGASPYTYQNLDGYSERVFVQGGTVSIVAVASSLGTFITTGVTQGMFVLENGDQLKVTYSVAPTMTKLPMR